MAIADPQSESPNQQADGEYAGEQRPRDALTVVGIGASAGGLRRCARSLPRCRPRPG